MPTTVRSFSKINLGLAIGPLRPDGFHALTTIYQSIDAHDLVTVEATPASAPSFRLTSNDARVPLDRRNTVAKMFAAAEASLHGAWAIHAHIEKRLPIQGGLGAGSANAAAALLALERETAQQLRPGDALRAAAQVGSDVPLFLLGGAVLGTGRGEQVTPLPDLAPEEVHVVLALPETGVSTPAAFAEWDAQAAALTPEAAHDRLTELSRICADAFSQPYRSSGVSAANSPGDLARQPLAALVRAGIGNDFEEVVFRLYPSLRTIKEVLLGARPLYAALSGSGSVLFALFADAEAAAGAERELQGRGTRALRSRLIGREEYWRQLFV